LVIGPGSLILIDDGSRFGSCAQREEIAPTDADFVTS
jgi:hypothetical protein